MSQPSPPKTYGITSPVSNTGPTESDKICTKHLVDTIAPFGVFEDKDEVDKRLAVLGRLNTLVKQFVRRVSEEKVCRDFFVVSDMLNYTRYVELYQHKRNS